MQKLLILGGDGYIGWPAAMRFSMNWQVTILDSLVKRHWENLVQISPLIPIPHLFERARIWEVVSGKKIDVCIGDLSNDKQVFDLLEELKPDAIIHFAEQPSAPFSMASLENAVKTQVNNVVGTLNLLFAMRNLHLDAHLVKLGTMGVYGTPNIDIEEGFLEVEHKGRKDRLPFPKQPGSFYHLSKVFDSQNLSFATPLWGLRVTDLHQGPVYGLQTEETVRAEGLHTSFHYDAVFGTVLNRFCLQAILSYPLTVYGGGGQKRAFINIVDSLRCIELTLESPPDKGEYRVFNQFTEVFSVSELADMVASAGKEIGLEVAIHPIDNPRIEKMEHHFHPVNNGLLQLGLSYNKLSDVILKDIFQKLLKFKNNADEKSLLPQITWQ